MDRRDSKPGNFGPARRRARPLFVVAFCALLAGCGVGKVGPAPRLLDLGTDSAPAPSVPARGAIALVPVAGAPLTGGTAVIWRVGDGTAPQGYATYRWAAPPAVLVGRRVAERLSRQGPVLEHNLAGTLPHLRLDLSRFEQEFDADGSSSRGRLVMQAVLVQGGRVLGQLRIDRSVPAPTADAPGGAQALRQATDEAADELAAWLAQHVAAAEKER